MIARKRGRMIQGISCVLVACATMQTANAQFFTGRSKAPVPPAAKPATPAKDQAAPANFSQQDVGSPTLERAAHPVNPTDPIAKVNGEVITRQQLSEECIVRKGEEILDTMISRRLIEQALREKKLEVTAAEIDQEIDNVAARVAHISREAWLRTLDKERNISPIQYARDIIFPALALRKLASNRVQVTPADMKNAFDAQYGDKLRVRLIMVDKLLTAQTIWEELRKNPGGFEKLAQERSMDSGSRSLGGLLAEPITRHAYPQTISDGAFRQLVDGDPDDKDKAHAPKDGDFTGPMQVAEATWVILKREGVIPAQPVDPKNENVRKGVYEMIYDVKLKEAMSAYFVDLMRNAAIDNQLSGHVKLANEENDPAHRVDREVKLMSNPDSIARPKAPAPGVGAGRSKLPTPAAASPEVVKQLESMRGTSAPKR